MTEARDGLILLDLRDVSCFIAAWLLGNGETSASGSAVLCSFNCPSTDMSDI